MLRGREPAVDASMQIDGTVASPYERAGAEEIAELMVGRRTAVLTGAGVSTDSGIPDYRSPGAPRRSPMTRAEFLGSPERRRRYWSGVALGAARMDLAEPNAGHRALATLERGGLLTGVATQNVDGLHQRAGSRRVVELHGHLRSVRCREHGHREDRVHLVARILDANPWLEPAQRDAAANPDGDASIPDARIADFRVPVCEVCGGMLEPEVVMFGQLSQPGVFAEAAALVNEADVLLVAGSSLVVNTGVRLVHRAVRQGKPVLIVNRGVTGADDLATLRVRAGTSELLAAVAALALPGTRGAPLPA